MVLDIEASAVLEGTRTGDSIAVNGVCLTVTPGKGHFTADAMPETLRRTSLGALAPGSKVNLERAMACGGRFGGISSPGMWMPADVSAGLSVKA